MNGDLPAMSQSEHDVWQARYRALNDWVAKVNAAAAAGGRTRAVVRCSVCSRQVAKVIAHNDLGLVLVVPTESQVVDTSRQATIAPSEARSLGVKPTNPPTGYALNFPADALPREPDRPEVACPRHGLLVLDVGNLKALVDTSTRSAIAVFSVPTCSTK